MTRHVFALVVCGAFTLAGCQESHVTKRSPTSPGVASRGAGNGAGTTAAGACDVLVPEDQPTIQDGIGAAGSGQTVCVEPGTYEEDVVLDRDVTLQGRTAARGGDPAVVDGRISVQADGATVRRLVISPSEEFTPAGFPDPYGVLVTASDVVVEGNVIRDITGNAAAADGSFTVHGIQVFGGAPPLTGIALRGNLVTGLTNDGDAAAGWPNYGGVAGIKLQAGLDGVQVTGNRIEDLHSAGWAWGVVLTHSASAAGVPENVTVTGNTVTAVNDGSVFDVVEDRSAAPYPGSAFGIDGGAEADQATLRYNNLLAPNGAESKDQDDALVAECNWWGHRSGPSNAGGQGTLALERGTAAIDFRPWLTAGAPARACNGGTGPGSGGR